MHLLQSWILYMPKKIESEQMWKRRGDEEELGDMGEEEEVEKCEDRWQRLCLAEGGKTDRGWSECSVCECVWMKHLSTSPHLVPTLHQGLFPPSF